MKTIVPGATMATLDVALEAGEAVFAEKGGMAWMSGDISMDTSSRGGVLSGLGRRVADESYFLRPIAATAARG